MSLWDQVKENFVELYSVAADKTGEAAKVGLRRYDKMGINWDIKRLMAELGGLTYNSISEGRNDIGQDPAVIDVIARIRELEAELLQKEDEIASIKRQGKENSRSSAGNDMESPPDSDVENGFESSYSPKLEPELEPELEAMPGTGPGSGSSKPMGTTNDPDETPPSDDEPRVGDGSSNL